MNGSAVERFKVADAVNDDEAVSKGQLFPYIKSIDGSGSGLDADLVDGVEGSLLGLGGANYSYVDETANRALGATYTSPSTKAIQALIQVSGMTAGAFLEFYIGTTLVYKVEASANGNASLSCIVTPGVSYKCQTSDAVGNLVTWMELK